MASSSPHAAARTDDCPTLADARCRSPSLAASEVVQQEDMALCADVQLSLEADEGQRGRFAPKYEHGMHAFHRLVYETLQGAAAE